MAERFCDIIQKKKDGKILSEEEIKGFSTYFIQGYESAKKEAHTLKKFESRK